MSSNDEGPSPSESLRWLVRQPQGRSALKWLVTTCGYTDEVFNTNNSQMSFNVGRRSVAVELLQQMRHADGDAFSKFLADIL